MQRINMSAFRVFCLTMLLFTTGIALQAQPKIEFPAGPTFDLGEIYRGEVVEHKVMFKNAGDETLIVQDVVPSCGCTGSLISQREVPAGGTGTILLTFNSKNFNGSVHKTVSVRSNAANAPTAIIDFTATVKQELIVTPLQLWFKGAEVGRETQVKFTVRNEGEKPVELKSYRTGLRGLSLKLPEKTIPPDSEATLVATFAPPKPVPTIADAVFITTTNPRVPELYVPVFGNAVVFKFE